MACSHSLITRREQSCTSDKDVRDGARVYGASRASPHDKVPLYDVPLKEMDAISADMEARKA